MILNILENLIYNNRCYYCGDIFFFKEQNLFCENCIKQIRKEDILYCKTCGRKTNNCIYCKREPLLNKIRIFTKYKHPLKDIIKYYKFNKYKNLSKTLANIIRDDIEKFVEQNNINFIFYIPMSKEKDKERGFNHLKEILIHIFPKFLISQDLIKIKDTKLQIELTKEEREKNLENSFFLNNKEIYKGKNILIFDDIITTGATSKVVVKELRKANPKNIYAYVMAT
ncbi:ComF family protein [Hydrogenothermus marinus]|uniref:ComF family protein n=1 Tax=Hydrogenothermus marinus TaxID=133270 RepID=A0A3M0B7S2_9AQUI|nr:phosphoribosyltransferase family protein [Hydrogenothermus marinus]RMA93157.1 ComF family protein [Hydrogenothermus marinus]